MGHPSGTRVEAPVGTLPDRDSSFGVKKGLKYRPTVEGQSLSHFLCVNPFVFLRSSDHDDFLVSFTRCSGSLEELRCNDLRGVDECSGDPGSRWSDTMEVYVPEPQSFRGTSGVRPADLVGWRVRRAGAGVCRRGLVGFGEGTGRRRGRRSRPTGPGPGPRTLLP